MASTAPKARVERSEAIDVLRGLAVLAVMVAHLPFSTAGLDAGAPASAAKTADVFPPEPLARWLGQGHYGVQLFLVVSGYCIHMRWARRGDVTTTVPFIAFWKRRLVRLYPPYMVALALSLGAVFMAFGGASHLAGPFASWFGYGSTGQLVLDLVLLLLLAQNLNGASSRVGNPPFWSLALEEQLYLLYFPLLAVRRAKGWFAALAMATVVTAAWLAAWHVVPETWRDAWEKLGPAYWIPWALGAYAVEVHLGHQRAPRWFSSPLSALACLVGAYWIPRPLRDVVVCFGFVALLSWLCRLESERKLAASRVVSLFAKLGAISYGVYLVHNLAFIVSKRILIAMHLPPLIVMPLRFGAGLLGGWLLWRFVELPFLERARLIAVRLVHRKNEV